MITQEKALELVLNNTLFLPEQIISLFDSVGMVLAEIVYSDVNVPPFNMSSVHGYAAKSEDVKRAPMVLKCIGKICAGDDSRIIVKFDECVEIMAGAALPMGTDCVVKKGSTKQVGNIVQIIDSVSREANVCIVGEDIHAEQRIIKKGTILSAAHINVLSSIGRKCVKVYSKPKVAVINIGNEIISVGEKLYGNKIYNSNGPLLHSLLKKDGFDCRLLGIAKDDKKNLSSIIKRGFKYNVFLISGGISVGGHDLVHESLSQMGMERIFSEVQMSPGNSLYFGIKDGIYIFGIQGDPLANYICYYLFFKHLFKKMMGINKKDTLLDFGIVQKAIVNKNSKYKRYLPIKIINEYSTNYLTPLTSNEFTNMFFVLDADGFLEVDVGVSTLDVGERARFFTCK